MPFDPDQFRLAYPGRAFPEMRFCAERKRWDAGRRLAAAFDAAAAGAGDVVWSLFDRAAPMYAGGGEAPHPGALLAHYAIVAGDELYVDWYLGDQARVGRRELLVSFDAYWQKGVDDVAVFDDSFAWVLYVTRDGGARLLRAGDPAGEEE